MKAFIVFLGLAAILLVTGACKGADEPAPPAAPTPSPMREWNLEGVRVDGSTIRVSLRVFAGIDVVATLDGKIADEVRPTPPTVEYVFRNVIQGKHTVKVRDVAGHSETVEVVMPPHIATPSPLPLPTWLTVLIHKLENEPVANPPASITRYEYQGRTVYFLPQRCCDISSTLYDVDGNIVAHPDGGITGQGDGRAPGFSQERTKGRTIWADRRSLVPGMVRTPAPIDSVEILILEIFPPQYNVIVVSGLPNSCASFAGYYLARSGNTIRAEMVNWKPANPDVVCAEVYGSVETTIPLGSDFESGGTYTVEVNDLTRTFVAQ
ncbi:MAG: hypothetical protein V3S82_06450 [Dehalococcoidia bacterium]